MPRYTSRDNVIYANFGAKRRQSSQQDTPSQTADSQHSRDTEKPHEQRPWLPVVSRFIVDTIEQRTDHGRTQRGRDYARGEHVMQLSYKANLITANVRGSVPDPFEVRLHFSPVARSEQRELIDYLASLPDYVPAFLRGELDRRTQRLLGFTDPATITAQCDCPDSHHVCKHIVAVAHAAAADISRHSYRIFDLRGWDPDTVEQAVQRRINDGGPSEEITELELSDHERETGAQAADSSSTGGGESTSAPAATEPVSSQRADTSAASTRPRGSNKPRVDAVAFWEGETLPGLPNPKVEPALDDSDLSLLHVAMRSVSYTSIDELRAITDIEDMYYFLTTQADPGMGEPEREDSVSEGSVAMDSASGDSVTGEHAEKEEPEKR
ncbi:hypothetical protein CCICO_04595 [Corynebacterium ciconiae DSM 44920]|uniref:SWIM zinc finger family protein n=1 Tax=Corynebacterium ciconiae TaxID=227319 RepID=UPI000374F114|nr:SWIM zinc finger family protein [Corynebacterium ciconiae]WKD60956.1 hypothetical protein CCICO_04595 [Corynebacterium ciconiae DSM 44920]